MKRMSHTRSMSNDDTAPGQVDGQETSRERYWRSLPDDTRETWAFLSIGTAVDGKRLELSEWHLATGNPVQLVRHRSSSSAQSDDQKGTALYDVLASLGEDGVTLHTPTSETIRQVRTILLEDEVEGTPTLRGFEHVAVLSLLEEFFAAREASSLPVDTLRGRPRETSTESVPVDCWKIRTAIEPLIPESALRGKPL